MSYVTDLTTAHFLTGRPVDELMKLTPGELRDMFRTASTPEHQRSPVEFFEKQMLHVLTPAQKRLLVRKLTASLLADTIFSPEAT